MGFAFHIQAPDSLSAAYGSRSRDRVAIPTPAGAAISSFEPNVRESTHASPSPFTAVLYGELDTDLRPRVPSRSLEPDDLFRHAEIFGNLLYAPRPTLGRFVAIAFTVTLGISAYREDAV